MKIRTNLLFEQDLELNIGPRTIVVGGNGVGKTMLLNALRLGLMGSGQDLGGKDQFAVVKAGSDLIELGDIHRSPYSELTLSSGHVAFWGLKPGKRATHVDLPGRVRYLMDEVMGAIRGGPDTRLAILVDLFCGMEADVVKWKRQKRRLASLKKKLKAVEEEIELLRRHGVESDLDLRAAPGSALTYEIKDLSQGVDDLRARMWDELRDSAPHLIRCINHELRHAPMKFHMNVTDKKIEMGLLRSRGDTMPLRYASGAQWVLLATAICAAVSSSYSPPPPIGSVGFLCIVTIPDRAYDETMIQHILGAAEGVKGVVLFPTVRETTREGWTTLNLHEVRDGTQQES